MPSSESVSSVKKQPPTWASRGSPHTDVGLIKSAGLGLFFSAWIYGLLWIIRENPFAAMFFQKSVLISWVPPAEVFLAVWALVILLLKYRKYMQQQQAFVSGSELQWPDRILIGDTSNLISQTENLSDYPQSFFLLHRIIQLLSHFRDSGNRTEVSSYLATQSEIDATVVNSSYTMVKVFIWAIPIFGFIGTVLGIGEAIGGFANLSDIDRLQEQLAPITGGLAGAFQTTLIALVLSLLIMFPTSALQRAELRLINNIDDFCNDQLLRQLSSRGTGNHPEDLKELAKDMGEQFATSLERTIQKITEHYKKLTSEVFDSVKAQHDELALLSNTIANAGQASIKVETRLSTLPQIISQLDSLPGQFADRITVAYGEALARESTRIQQVFSEIYDSQSKHTDALLEAFRNENETLTETTQNSKYIAEATDVVSRRLEDLPQHFISTIEEKLDAFLSRFGEEMNTVVKVIREATEGSLRSFQDIDKLSNQLNDQLQAILTDVNKWPGSVRETTDVLHSSLSVASHDISESADAFRTSLAAECRGLIKSIQESQASMVECLNSLQVAMVAISQLVNKVDARRELDILQAAVERVSHIMNTNPYSKSSDSG